MRRQRLRFADVRLDDGWKSEMVYYWKGERPRDPNAPQLDGTGEIRLESADRGISRLSCKPGAICALSTTGAELATANGVVAEPTSRGENLDVVRTSRDRE